MLSKTDRGYLSECLTLASEALGAVRPNPLVGAVITKDENVISTGIHDHYGGPHAEALALEGAGEGARGATLYCNLEPCSFSCPEKHNGPCTEKIINAGVRRVIIGQIDPNPRVCGRGLKKLRDAGIEVKVDDSDEHWYANARFNTIQTGSRPFVTIKLAQSLDGKIACSTGDSKWISDEDARLEVHKMRADHDAVAVGSGTLLRDDPQLTARTAGMEKHPNSKQPRPVVFDGNLNIPLDSYLIRQRSSDLIVVTVSPKMLPTGPARQSNEKQQRLKDLGVEIIEVSPDPRGGVSLTEALSELKQQGINSLMLEGGAKIVSAFLQNGLFDALQLYIAPIFIGGDGLSLSPLGTKKISDSLKLEGINIQQLGQQVSLRGFRCGWLKEVKRAIREEDDVHRIG